MFVLVTLVCLYFGLWEITKRWGVEEYPFYRKGFLRSSRAIGPLVVKLETLPIIGPNKFENVTRYELWLFGPRFTIWEWSEPPKKPGQILPSPYYFEPSPEFSN